MVAARVDSLQGANTRRSIQDFAIVRFVLPDFCAGAMIVLNVVSVDRDLEFLINGRFYTEVVDVILCWVIVEELDAVNRLVVTFKNETTLEGLRNVPAEVGVLHLSHVVIKQHEKLAVIAEDVPSLVESLFEH